MNIVDIDEGYSLEVQLKTLNELKKEFGEPDDSGDIVIDDNRYIDVNYFQNYNLFGNKLNVTLVLFESYFKNYQFVDKNKYAIHPEMMIDHDKEVVRKILNKINKE